MVPGPGPGPDGIRIWTGTYRVLTSEDPNVFVPAHKTEGQVFPLALQGDSPGSSDPLEACLPDS